MFATLTRWLGTARPLTCPKRPPRRPTTAVLGVEGLEAREVPSAAASYLAGGYTLDPSGNLTQTTAAGPVLVAHGVTEFVQGQTASGEHVLYTLGADGTVNERTASGAAVFATGVQELIQSVNGYGVPCAVFLADGRFQQSNDGATTSTIDLGGTVTAMAEGRDAAGRQVLYALRVDGVLFVDRPDTGVGVLATGVRTLIQSWGGGGVPVPTFLANGQFQQTVDGAAVSTIGLGGTITAIAEGRDPAGQQLLYAVRSDGALFEFAPAGVRVFATGVRTMLQAYGG
ncbi:MAG TPA: hypothetical protein VH092_26030, partial [Urbifossiella sp.]|nr:hypothetical protein [Urbifossiella sp.]